VITIFKLHQQIDDTVNINHQIYKVDMSFDNILLLLELLNDSEITNTEKILHGINILLGVSFLYDIETQVKIFNELLEKFIMTSERETSYDVEGNPMPTPKKDKHFDLDHDAEYIYASFYQAYGIDLIDQQGKLHWYKFQALLAGLPEDTQFRHVIDIRTRPYQKGKGTYKENRQLKKLKEKYALPGTRIKDIGGERDG